MRRDRIKCVTDFQVEKQRVFLRLDLNVPIHGQQILDDTRLVAVLPTIEYLLKQGAKLLVASHLGRPVRPQDRKHLSLMPVANRLSEKLQMDVVLVEDVMGDAPIHLISSLKPSQILMLENLRFDPGESQNSPRLASHFASYTDIYINDAFATCHRSHASILGLPQVVEKKGIGFLIEKELNLLDSLFQAERPFALLLGGAKVSDKLGMLRNLMDRVDTLMVGGMMAYTFLKAEGVEVGDAPVEKDQIPSVKDLLHHLELRGKTCLLPLDHVVVPSAKDISSATEHHITEDARIPQNHKAYDIGPKTLQAYKEAILKHRTLFWNGPLGFFEKHPFAQGTLEIAQVLAQSNVHHVVGGGDTASAVRKAGLTRHVLTGGGASLKYLQGKGLPGLDVLKY